MRVKKHGLTLTSDGLLAVQASTGNLALRRH